MSTTMSGGEIMPFCATENLQNLPLVEWCYQYWIKFPSLVFEIWSSQGFCDVHTRTDTPENSMLPAPRKIFDDGGMETIMPNRWAYLLYQICVAEHDKIDDH